MATLENGKPYLAANIPFAAKTFRYYAGWGRELGWQGIEQYTELKSVITAL